MNEIKMVQREKKKVLKLKFIFAGCPRVAGDEEDSREGDDFEDELQIKGQQPTGNHHALNHSVITI